MFNIFFSDLDTFFRKHHVDIVKDIIVPTFGIDKIIALIAIVVAIRSLRTNNKIAQINLLFQLNSSHRDIWSKVVDKKLIRINDPNADSSQISQEEERYIVFLILHIHTLFEASLKGLYDFNKSGRLDVGSFFNNPLPSSVWANKKRFYSDKFVEFIDRVTFEAQLSPSIKISFVQDVKQKLKRFGRWIREIMRRISPKF